MTLKRMIDLQEMLKEKQQEIEMLRKERDLERERITKAATQADHAEQKILKLQKEYDKVVLVCLHIKPLKFN